MSTVGHNRTFRRNLDRHATRPFIESSQFPPGTVAEKSYNAVLWDDELLGPARVRVAQ